MRQRWIAILLWAAAWHAQAQTTLDLSRQGKLGTGVTLPAQCNVGQVFFKTDAPSGANVFTCTTANTWSVVGISSAGTGIVVAGNSIAVEDAVVPVYYAGAGAPVLSCTTGRDLYVDTAAGTLYYCRATGVWQAVSNADHTHDANDTGSFALVEEFPPASLTSGAVGTHGWDVASFAGGCATAWEGSFANRPGVLGLRASGSNGGCALGLSGLVPSLAGLVWSAKWSWSAESAYSATNLTLRMGLGNNAATGNPPSDGVWVKWQAGTDANWKVELYSGGVAVGSVDSGVAYQADNLYTARFRGDGARWYVAISTNGGTFSTEKSICPAACAITGALPAAALGPFAQALHGATADGATKRLYVDRFSMQVSGLTR